MRAVHRFAIVLLASAIIDQIAGYKTVSAFEYMAALVMMCFPREKQ